MIKVIRALWKDNKKVAQHEVSTFGYGATPTTRELFVTDSGEKIMGVFAGFHATGNRITVDYTPTA